MVVAGDAGPNPAIHDAKKQFELKLASVDVGFIQQLRLRA